MTDLLGNVLEKELTDEQKSSLTKRLRHPKALDFEFEPKDMRERAGYNQFFWLVKTK